MEKITDFMCFQKKVINFVGIFDCKSFLIVEKEIDIFALA